MHGRRNRANCSNGLWNAAAGNVNSGRIAAMHWSDEGIILSRRRHGETAAVVSLLTRSHGRHAGLVRGGGGRRAGGLLQPGNEVAAEWRARLPEHLGTWQLDAKRAVAAEFLDDPLRLAALASACALADTALPEREPHRSVYEGFRVLLGALTANDPTWPPVYVRWELGLLAELGFGLDLERCAATGTESELTHVSPKSGRAVSAAAARPYGGRLLPLPAFLANGRGSTAANDSAADLRDGLALTEFFLERHVYAPHQRKLPAARARLVARLTGGGLAAGVL